MNARLQEIEQICRKYQLKALYVFGSRSADMLQAIKDSQYQLGPSQSDLDIGVLSHSPFSIENKVSLTLELENLFGLPSIDLFILLLIIPHRRIPTLFYYCIHFFLC